MERAACGAGGRRSHAARHQQHGRQQRRCLGCSHAGRRSSRPVAIRKLGQSDGGHSNYTAVHEAAAVQPASTQPRGMRSGMIALAMAVRLQRRRNRAERHGKLALWLGQS